ncbi:MAG TPA: hypothetical protein VF008_22495 [Niastella sp.]
MSTLAKEELKIEAGSNMPEVSIEAPKHMKGSEKVLGNGKEDEELSASSFTTFYTWRANGVHRNVRFNHPAVNANSRVFLSISEYGADPRTTRFIGAAKMEVLNVAPFNGGFFAWVEISWGAPLNVRFDVLVDPS